MDPKEKEAVKELFQKQLDELVAELREYVSDDEGGWTIKGFIDKYKNIYTISADTKIVSKILEIHIFPEIMGFAEKNGYTLELAKHQNWYPDITLISKENPEIKFALDLKTTFRRGKNITGFTLGSHGAYFIERDKSKNIQYPYNQYTGHYCLGVIYTQEDFGDELTEVEVIKAKDLQEKGDIADPIKDREVTEIAKLEDIKPVIKDFEFFAQEKWKISSDQRGSGNTANIGSIKDLDLLKKGEGVFHQLGEEYFDEYWINYGKATIMRGGKPVPVTSLIDFLEFKGESKHIGKIGQGAKKRKKK